MATVATLTQAEQQVLDRLVPALLEALGDALESVWLYGSRARGEPPRDEDSDVDLLVLVEDVEQNGKRVDAIKEQLAEEAGIWPGHFHLFAHDRQWLKERRGIRAFFVEEIDRDKVVLYERDMDPRAKEYLEQADKRWPAVELSLPVSPDAAISGAYHALFAAARAALAERNLFARTHRGTWHLIHEHLVLTGELDADLVAAAAAMQRRRKYADYGPKSFSRDEAEADVRTARRFIAAVRALLEERPQRA
jgi:uncharacterized protein (UPF0332 family)/predicted nucleotidyltransferase